MIREKDLHMSPMNLDTTDIKTVMQKLDPMDLVLFKGGDFVSKFITTAEKFVNGVDTFSHVGVIVTRESCGLKFLKKNRKYIWESTMSGPLGNGVKNVQGKSMLGVQVRDIGQLLKNCRAAGNVDIAVAKIHNNPFLSPITCKDVTKRLRKCMKLYNGRNYDYNCFSLGSALFPAIRGCRRQIEKHTGTQKWMFCSELVASVYRDIGIIEETVCPSDVLPTDFIDNSSPKVNSDTFHKYVMICSEKA